MPMERPAIPELGIRKTANIHAEMRRHTAILGEWLRFVADAEARLEFAEEKLEFASAKIRKMERASLVRTYGKSGVTEKAINDELLCYSQIRKGMTRVRKLRAEMRGAKAIVTALHEKTKTLQSYGGLLRRELENLGAEP